MADRRRGAANVYDVPAYKEPEKIKRTEPSHSSAAITYSSGTKEERMESYIKTFIIVIIVAAAMYGVIDAKVQATAIRNEINTEQSVVDMLRSENTRMKAEIESKSSMKAVESYAENILGMQKLEKSQCEYITLESGNIIEIPENSNDFFVKLKSAFSEFIDYIRG